MWPEILAKIIMKRSVYFGESEKVCELDLVVDVGLGYAPLSWLAVCLLVICIASLLMCAELSMPTSCSILS